METTRDMGTSMKKHGERIEGYDKITPKALFTLFGAFIIQMILGA